MRRLLNVEQAVQLFIEQRGPEPKALPAFKCK